MSQSGEEHERPDVENHCPKLGVWVRFVFWPLNQIRPERDMSERHIFSDLEAPQESERREVEKEKSWK